MVKQNIVGALREQSDWEQQDENRLGFIKNKPFYDNRKIAPLAIKIDELTELESANLDENPIWKCSNHAPTKEEFIGATVTILTDGMTTETILTQEMLIEEDGLPLFGVWVDEIPICLVALQDTSLCEVPLSTGIWILNPDIQSFYLPSVTTGELKTINEKFIPDTIARTSDIEPEINDIPKVFFGGDLAQTKDDIIMSFRYVSKTKDIRGYCKTKAQGNSSMSYPKKNQTVKLYTDETCSEKLKVNFKGWGEQNKFCFKANWIDISHARNIVSARLWADVVRSRANYEELSELYRTSPNQGAVDGFPVKVYANGVYQGRYTINIPKDGWMANMDDSLDKHCILCGENYVSSCFRAAANINGADWSDELHDTVPSTIKTRWNEVINFVMTSTDEEFRKNLSDYFYVDSLIDYHLFGLAICHLDGYGKNQLYMTYDGSKWIAQVYDLDSTWGLYFNGSKFVSESYGRDEYEDFVSGREGNLLFMRLEECFVEELRSRWAELKNGALSIDNVINHFEHFTDIADAALVAEDYASTTGGGLFTGIPSKTTNNIQQIRGYALQRRLWVDDYMESLLALACESITLSESTLTFSSEGEKVALSATTVPEASVICVTWESDNTDVATVDENGVVIAWGNGTANITARCGDQYATCEVTVSGIENSSLLYVLPAATTMQATDKTLIDTGIQLFDESKDFTVFIDFQPLDNSTTYGELLHCMHEAAPFNGIVFGLGDDSAGKYRIATGNTYAAKVVFQSMLKTDTNRHKLSIVHRASEDGTFYYFLDDTDGSITFANHAAISETLLIGGYVTANGTYGRYWNGTVYDCKVWNRALTNEEIKNIMNESADINCESITLSNYTITSSTYRDKFTLVATVVPQECSSFVTWESDNPSVATVNEGVVTILDNGTATITARCHNQSASCIVTADNIVDNTIVYQLSNTTFNAADETVIDTGLQLFEEEQKDFSILIDFASGAENDAKATVFHCMHEQGTDGYYYQGLTLNEASGAMKIASGGYSNQLGTLTVTDTTRTKLLVVFDTTRPKINYYLNNDTLNELTKSIKPIPETLVLGGYTDRAGGHGRYWNGTIYEYKVWNRVLTNDEITKIMSD
jgi:uncharacterized protein YjdB